MAAATGNPEFVLVKLINPAPCPACGERVSEMWNAKLGPASFRVICCTGCAEKGD